jgi:hypothetical protein
MSNYKDNKRKIIYKDIDLFIEENSNNNLENLDNLISLLGAFLDHLICYSIDDDYDNFGIVRNPMDREKIIDFLEKNNI